MDDSFDPPSVLLSTVDPSEDTPIIVDELHSSDCSTCMETEDLCEDTEEYVWEDYSKFNNCRTGDCKECLNQRLGSSGYCTQCFQQECECRQDTVSVEQSTCDKCESPYECVCEMLIAHGNCATCLCQGGECECVHRDTLRNKPSDKTSK